MLYNNIGTLYSILHVDIPVFVSHVVKPKRFAHAVSITRM